MTEINTLLAQPQQEAPDLISTVISALEDYDKEVLEGLFQDLDAVDTAHLLEFLPDAFRMRLWKFIAEEHKGDVLVELGEVARLSLASNLENEQIVEAVSNLDSNDLAEMVDTLPDEALSRGLGIVLVV